MTKQKKVLLIMTIISAVILLAGISIGLDFYFVITKEIHTAKDVLIDGADFSALIRIFGEVTAFVFAAISISSSVILIALQWLVYGIVMLIRNNKRNPEISHENPPLP